MALLVLLAGLAGCTTSNAPNPTAVRSVDWPEDALQGRRYHAFRPMGSVDNALRALRDLGPQLSAVIPGTDRGRVSSVDADEQRVVFGWSWWEEQALRGYPYYSPFCPPGSRSVTCDDWDFPPTVPSRRIQRQGKGAVLYRDIADIRLDTSGGVTVLQSSGAPMALSAPSKQVADMVADAFFTLARAAGRTMATPPGVTARDLGPRLASVLRVAHGVQVTGVMSDSPADAAGLRRLDVITQIDGRPARADELRAALSTPGETLLEGIRYPLEAKAGNMPPTRLHLVVRTPGASP